MASDTNETIEQVVIIGSGPAGYTAALYTARANLNPLVIEGFLWGGLLQQTTEVENFPGYPEGIMGPDMMQQLRDQAERFGARMLTDQATKVEPGSGSEPHTVWVGDEAFKARTVILAMGAEHRKLGCVGEEELGGRGVSYCATCDAAFYKDKPTIIVGGGDSAMEEAIFLAKFASEVDIVHRRDEFRASKIMLERARAAGNIRFLTPFTVEAFHAGEDGKKLEFARLRNVETGEIVEQPMSGAFIAIGHVPNSEIVQGIVDVDENGYVKVEGRSTLTNVPGIFAAGDLVDHTYRQAITAAGSGCQAALDAEWYLRDNPNVPTPEALENVLSVPESHYAPAASGAPAAQPATAALDATGAVD
ncbi:MAG TPA: thioredoxin-disulfide reductase [Solirubrobacteraceae bacterium]